MTNPSEEYLLQARYALRRIAALRERIALYRELATRTTANIEIYSHAEGLVQSRVENCVAKVVDLSREAGPEIEKLYTLLDEITEAVRAIPDRQMQILLNMRYLNPSLLSWKEISQMLDIPLRTMFRLHASALEQIKPPKDLICKNGTTGSTNL